MSGIYIPKMEMPKNCNECPIAQGYFKPAYCGLNGSIPKLWEEFDDALEKEIRPDFCPLIEVPKHGRLIDADALTIILSKVIDINASIEQRNEATDQERRCLWWFEQQIGIAPTIIEAEGGE